jgi:hypothetical protein
MIKMDLLDGRSFEIRRNPNDNLKRVFRNFADNLAGMRGMQTRQFGFPGSAVRRLR